MTTYVLVHGGHHGGWCYRKVAGLIRKAGHEVYTPTLTGLGERRHLNSQGEAARLQQHPWKCYTQKLWLQGEAAVRRIRRTEINCAARVREFDDRRKAELLQADRAWEIDTGHDVMVTEPERLAQILLGLA